MNKYTPHEERDFASSTQDKNVLGEPLEPCSYEPLTGYFRDGCCNTDDHDAGRHLVCGVVTAEFLAYSQSMGNDLITPRAAFKFPGLKPGDRWCLCVHRWYEAYLAGCAPHVILESTHQDVLTFISSDVLTALAEQSERGPV